MKQGLRALHIPIWLLFFLAAMITGFLLAGQIVFSSTRGALRNLSIDELNEIYVSVQREVTDMRVEVLSLKSRIDDFSEATQDKEKLIENLEAEIRTLEGVLGLKPVRGPGVKIIISVQETVLSASDLVDVFNELKASGAEAVAVNGIRAQPLSYFVVRGGRYFFDNQEINPPFVFDAIGDPDTLFSAVTISGGVVNALEAREGVAVVVSREERLVLPARSRIVFQYSEPVE